MMQYKAIIAASVMAMMAAGSSAWAAVSAEEAGQLKTTLTPLGAEKAGNKEGTIPAWTGEAVAVPGASGGKYPDPFPNEKPSFQITAQNMGQYASKLTEGTQAMLKKYPSFHIDVYPTHRTYSAPQWVYDNTFHAATTAKLTDNGLSFEGAWAAIPFPIPKNGNEVMMNQLRRLRTPSLEIMSRNFVGSSDGKKSLAAQTLLNYQYLYWLKDSKPASEYMRLRVDTVAPNFKVGEAVMTYDDVNVKEDPQSWQYLVGQRRVRRAPTIAYDTPDFIASGANYFDEVNGYFGRLDRYEWKLVGKQEMYVPYNDNKFFAEGEDKAFVPYHINPDVLRWELHRVWVVDATLAQGKRHAVPKRRLYIDEDSWSVLAMDGYDAEGKLWRVSYVMPMLISNSTVSLDTSATIVYNLQASTFSVIQYTGTLNQIPPRPLTYYTADALANSSLR